MLSSGVLLVTALDLEGAEYLLVGFSFLLPGVPCFLVATAAAVATSQRELRVLAGGLLGALPAALVYLPLASAAGRWAEAAVAVVTATYWLPFFLPVTMGLGAAVALWVFDAAGQRQRAPKQDALAFAPARLGQLQRTLRIALPALAVVGGIVLSLAVGRAMGVEIPILHHFYFLVLPGGPLVVVGILAATLRSGRALYRLAGVFAAALVAPLPYAAIVVDVSDYRGGGVNMGLAFLGTFSPVFLAAMMGWCAAAGVRLHRLKCGEGGWGLLRPD